MSTKNIETLIRWAQRDAPLEAGAALGELSALRKAARVLIHEWAGGEDCRPSETDLDAGWSLIGEISEEA